MGGQILSKAQRSFPKSRRLQRSGDFLRLKTEGQRQVVGCLICNWKAGPPPTGPRQKSGPPEADRSLPDDPAARRAAVLAQTQLGVVSSRSIGGAVERNRARRLMREVFRLHQGSLQQPVRMVLVARPSIAHRGFAAVERDFLQCLRRAGLDRRPEGPRPEGPSAAPATAPSAAPPAPQRPPSA